MDDCWDDDFYLFQIFIDFIPIISITGWRFKTEKAIKQYEEEMAEYMGDIVNDLEALQDLETFSVDTI